ncbi:hypothetical protein FHG87_019750 [Trinorchestia longiramus]|nr:hypothetical protein FHG87_019750 [Trinorchestia longiramus]
MADTASESSDEARIPSRTGAPLPPMNEQDNRSEYRDEPKACYNCQRQLTNEWTRSGSNAQPTAQHKKAATLCVTDSTKPFQSQHLHQIFLI